MGPQTLPTGVFGPLPEGTVGLVLGRGSATQWGLKILTGVVDADYQGEIKIVVEATQGLVILPPGERIAQLLLLPLVSIPGHALRGSRGDGSFGSTGTIQAFWVAHLDSRPNLTIEIQDKAFKGILDTGADVSVISENQWPPAWPLQSPSAILQGIGQTRPKRSASFLKWRDNEGHSGHFQPYVVTGLPTNLWGRDLLHQMGAILTTQTLKGNNNFVNETMLDMGWIPGRGLGKRHEGKISPVDPTEQVTRWGRDRRGLGNLS